MSAERPTPQPIYAPDAVLIAISDFKNRESTKDHTEVFDHAAQVLFPVIEALSVTERLPDEKFRRTLDYPLEVRVGDGPYWIDATQYIENGSTRSLFINASTYSPDLIHVAVLQQRHEGHDDKLLYKTVETGNRHLANKRELKEIVEVIDLIAQEAPRQALAEGRISPSWMERWNLTGSIDLPCAEGFPRKPAGNSGEPKLYEIVQFNGVRRVCTVEENEGSLRWKEDVHGEVKIDESRVAAWREIKKNGVLPDYYKKAKYPSLYAARV